MLEEAGLLDEEDKSLRDSLRAQFNEILSKEDTYWRQRSRDR